jgi:hypothetical protein
MRNRFLFRLEAKIPEPRQTFVLNDHGTFVSFSEKAKVTLAAHYRVSKKFLPIPPVRRVEIHSDNSSFSAAKGGPQL